MKDIQNNEKVKSAKGYKKVILVLWVFVVLIIAAVAFSIFFISQGWLGKLPPISDLHNPINKYASRIYSSDGKVIGTWSYASENRVMVPYDSLPDNLVKALVATEDVRFYNHSGIDLRAVARAVVKRGLLHQKSAGGGSTITQQLAKQLYSDVAENTRQRLMQKPIEWYIAVQLERYYTKEEIITMYLNYFDFLNNAVGIRNAANTYFGKEPSQLNLVESATLVGMLKGPSYYNPRLHPERSRERRNTVIRQMVKYDFLTEAEGRRLEALPLHLDYTPDNHYSGLAPYLRERIRQDALRILREYNAKHGTAYNLYEDGLVLVTTLDAEMQRFAEEAVAAHLPHVQEAYEEHLHGREPWAARPEILADAVRNSGIYKTLKAKGMDEVAIRKALDEKSKFLISESIARKWFGNEPAVGKAVFGVSGNSCTIGGVYRDFPSS